MVTTKTMTAAEFKAKCLDVLDRVAESGHGVVVTKRGRPVAQVVPMITKPTKLVGVMKREIAVTGDIVGPLGLPWKASSR
jgi:prevent-host-death family protein